MDLSQELEKLNFRRSLQEAAKRDSISSSTNSIINVEDLSFEDEQWLQNCMEETTDLKTWLYNAESENSDSSSQKYFDTRTFTRPKKRLSRPSIERYNQELFGTNTNDHSIEEFLKSETESKETAENTDNATNFNTNMNSSIPSKPINFDFAQPTSSYYFENMLSKAGDYDSFQNMSPPSLVNSLCSSTFANLMENSFIKNDPVLREIRDTDYTQESILLQDLDPPLLQSLNDSLSSIDTPEIFLKKLSFNGTFKKNLSNAFEKSVNESKAELNATYEKINDRTTEIQNKTFEKENSPICDNQNKTEEKSDKKSNYNTYRKVPKSSATFRRPDASRPLLTRNTTFDKSNEDLAQELNSPDIMVPQNVILIDASKTLNGTTEIKETMKNSYYNEERTMNEHKNIDLRIVDESCDKNKTVDVKRNSLLCSTGSADSLDNMSSLSNSSKGSQKMLNMSDVDAIVEMQERSLQIMSTPKPHTTTLKKLWDHNVISPIINPEKEHHSDSEVSSTEDYKTARSSISKTSVNNGYISNAPKSFGYQKQAFVAPKQKSRFTIAEPKNIQQTNPNIRKSYTNLKTLGIYGSQGNLHKPTDPSRTISNLKSMRPSLKSSYTSLRPISKNLPVAPPPVRSAKTLDETTTLTRASNPNVTQIVESSSTVQRPVPLARVQSTETFVKPALPKFSGLPRPVGSGLPRPISRIPGPNSRISRPQSSYSKQTEGYY